jgi:uncharacterized protein with HEPN domain
VKRKREYRDYLNDIIEAITDVASFIEGMSYKEFLLDKKTFHAVVRSIEIIGEAAKQVPKSVRDKAPDIPWKEMVGMRNKIAHEYFGIDSKIVWDTAKRYLPKLRRQMLLLLRREKS